MINRKRLLIACCLVAIFAVGLALITSSSSKYRLGMTMEEVQQKIGSDYKALTAAVDYQNGPTEVQMETDPIYLIQIEPQGLSLSFNSRRKLIQIKRFWGLMVERTEEMERSRQR